MGIGDFEPPGPPGAPLGLRAKFGLVSDPGGLANDVSKAKNLIQIFSGENACFSQSRPVKEKNLNHKTKWKWALTL